MAGLTEGLEVVEIVAPPVDQRNDVVEFPERSPGREAFLTKGPGASPAAHLASESIGVQLAVGADRAVALAHKPAKFPGIAGVVGVDALGVPPAAAVDLALLGPGSVKDRFSAPAAAPALGVRELDRRPAMIAPKTFAAFRLRRPQAKTKEVLDARTLKKGRAELEPKLARRGKAVARETLDLTKMEKLLKSKKRALEKMAALISGN